jgi:hypothetical protein
MFKFRRKKNRNTAGNNAISNPVRSEVVSLAQEDYTRLLHAIGQLIREEFSGPLHGTLAAITDNRTPVAESINALEHQLRLGIESLTRAIEAVGTAAPEPDTKGSRDQIEFDLANPDERYASIIHGSVGRAPSTASNGELTYLTIIGQLRDGSIAWQNDETRTFGTLTKEMLGEMTPLADDKIRARVVSYPWGHRVIGVVPDSLVSPFATRPVPSAPASSSAGTPPDSITDGPFASLKPGDVVLARVPYDGMGPLDRDGNTGKSRPNVFIRWERDYAVLRAIYDRNGYVAHNDLGMGLVDTGCLDKPSVVRNTEYDIDPRNISRRLGRLGPRDLHALHIEDVPDDGNTSTLSPVVRTMAPQAINSAVSRPAVDPMARESHAVITAVARHETQFSEYQLMELLLQEFRSNSVFVEVLRTEGIHHAQVGHLFAELLKSRGMNPEKGLFRRLFDRYMADSPSTGSDIFVTERDENNHPVLKLVNRVDSPLDEENVPDFGDYLGESAEGDPRILVDDEYLEPNVIIYDQHSMSAHLKQRRIQLDDALQALRAGGAAPGFVIGSDAEPPLAQFHFAARQRGWKTKVAQDRRELAEAALRVATECAAEVVTVVGIYQDVVAELENSGYEVNFVCSFDD